MKKILSSILFLVLGVVTLSAQSSYLVNQYTPIDSHQYTAYKSTSAKKMAMSGGLQWGGGFSLRCSVAPYTPGYATFNLSGEYETLMFVLGSENHGRGAGGSGIDLEPNLVTVYADGRKIMDSKIYYYDVPKRISLNIKGVRELKFSIVQGNGYIGIGEATLWRSGQSAVESGNLITQKPKSIELMKDLRPYFQNNRFVNISPSDATKSIKVNGREYPYGLRANMDRALVGNNQGWVYFNLRGQYSQLSFVAGPENNQNKNGSGWLTVKADGKTIYEAETRYDEIAQRVILDVGGCSQLSFHTEQESGSSTLAIVDAQLYPEGEVVAQVTGSEATKDPRLSQLPDVCKLISNIPPYATGSIYDKQVYDGSSDYITFSMGGQKFSEGVVFCEKGNLLSGNTSSYALFDVGSEFDYISFTAGYIGASGTLINDVLRLYGDDELLFETQLIATYPNKKYIVPLNRCRKLRFENRGSAKMDVAAFGIGDAVLYRGEVVDNDLFVREKPETPDNVELIDLGAPYIHYVAPLKGEKIFLDGSTIREYFEVNGERIYKGFLLQTSVHFSLDFGIFHSDEQSGGGSESASAGAVGSIAVGSAFVAGTAAVGGAVVGSTLAGVAALMMLAAGGTALENSCAAFDTYGEYSSLTFTVACYKPSNHNSPDSYTETLFIGADGFEVAKVALTETMAPQTITVPLDGCEQLMFWLANTNNTSGQYLFYDIKLAKETLSLNIPKDARLSTAVITTLPQRDKVLVNGWEQPQKTNQSNVDEYVRGVTSAYNSIGSMIKGYSPYYEILTYYLETQAGQICKAVSIRHQKSNNLMSITNELRSCNIELEAIIALRGQISDTNIKYASATVGLLDLGLGAISYRKVLRQANVVLKECKEILAILYDEKLEEARWLQALVDMAVDIDGKSSTDRTILCPLFGGEQPPVDGVQMVCNFNVE